MNNAVKIIIKSIVFIVCLGLIIVGQKKYQSYRSGYGINRISWSAGVIISLQ